MHQNYDLGQETEAFQTLLEGHRVDPDNDELFADMLKARDRMQQAWLQHHVGELEHPASVAWPEEWGGLQ